ncbi:MAG: cytochrome c oxidase subunit 3, partial [Paracoccus sp. (in: a-proteobacteria)]
MDQSSLAMAQEIDFSLLALFLRASLTVKLVMIILVVASFWSWAIIIRKFIAYRAARSEAEAFDRAFWSGEPLDELFDQIGPAPEGASQKIFAAGMLGIVASAFVWWRDVIREGTHGDHTPVVQLHFRYGMI